MHARVQLERRQISRRVLPLRRVHLLYTPRLRVAPDRGAKVVLHASTAQGDHSLERQGKKGWAKTGNAESVCCYFTSAQEWCLKTLVAWKIMNTHDEICERFKPWH